MTKDKEQLKNYYLTLVSVGCRQVEGIKSMEGKKNKMLKKLEPWLKEKEKSLIFEKDPVKIYTLSMFTEVVEKSFLLGEMDPEGKVDELGQKKNEKRT